MADPRQEQLTFKQRKQSLTSEVRTANNFIQKTEYDRVAMEQINKGKGRIAKVRESDEEIKDSQKITSPGEVSLNAKDTKKALDKELKEMDKKGQKSRHAKFVRVTNALMNTTYDGGDSEKMQNLKKSLAELTARLTYSYSIENLTDDYGHLDHDKVNRLVDEVKAQYKSVIDACRIYEEHEPWSLSGKARREMAIMIRGFCEFEMPAFEGAALEQISTCISKGEKTVGVNDILFKIRASKVADDSFKEKVGGGKQSNVYKVQKDGKNYFFSEDSRVRKEMPAYRVARIDEGTIIGRRNVATSRMADLLGMKDVVAKSETAVLENKEKTVTGNLMEAAEGITFVELFKQARDTKKIVCSPEVAHKFFKLQVLDFICGQTDRNLGNAKVVYEYDRKKDKYIVKDVRGIDNDNSFGDIENRDFIYGDINSSSFPGIINDDDELCFKTFDKGLLEKLKALNTDSLKILFCDLDINDHSIDQLLERRDQLVENIDRAMKKGNLKLVDDMENQKKEEIFGTDQNIFDRNLIGLEASKRIILG